MLFSPQSSSFLLLQDGNPKQDMTAIIESAVKGEEVNGDLCV